MISRYLSLQLMRIVWVTESETQMIVMSVSEDLRLRVIECRALNWFLFFDSNRRTQMLFAL